MAYPYQKAFMRFLTQSGRAKSTIADYDRTMELFYQFQLLQENEYTKTLDPNDLFEPDVRAFFSNVLSRDVQNNTYDKYLSHVNVYFKYLFTRDLIEKYPTLALKGQPKENLDPIINTEWVAQLPKLLKNDQLTYYTRMMLLMISKGYQVNEMLQDGFYSFLSDLTFSSIEKEFLSDFETFHQPLVHLQKNHNLFLKTRLKQDEPLLTLPALHKYLRKDKPLVDFPLIPNKLYQGYVLSILSRHDQSDQELMQTLRIDPSGLEYYQKLLKKQGK